MLTGGTERTGEWNVDWRKREAGERNMDWRNRSNWRVECCLEEQSGLERGMLT